MILYIFFIIQYEMMWYNMIWHNIIWLWLWCNNSHVVCKSSPSRSKDKLMGRRILRHTYRSRALAFVVNVARGERSEEDASRLEKNKPKSRERGGSTAMIQLMLCFLMTCDDVYLYCTGLWNQQTTLSSSYCSYQFNQPHVTWVPTLSKHVQQQLKHSGCIICS